MLNQITGIPTISVIMSVYNGEKYLREAIDSIFSQSFTDFEFIIIDDGSTDKTNMILQEYANKDKRIILIHQEKNSGLINCLNLGLSLARGKYVARMDADDTCLPDRFAVQKEFLDNNTDIGLVGSNFYVINSAGRIISNFINNPNLPKTPNQIAWALCFSGCIAHPSIMARIELLNQAGGYRKTAIHAEDYDLWTRMALITNFYNLPQKLVNLRRHDNNITVIYGDTTIFTRKRVSKDYISLILRRSIPMEMMDYLYSTQPLNLFWSEKIVTLFDELLQEFISTKNIVKSDEIIMKKHAVQIILEMSSRINTSKQVRKFLLQSARNIKATEVSRYLAIRIMRNIWKTIKQIIYKVLSTNTNSTS